MRPCRCQSLGREASRGRLHCLWRRFLKRQLPRLQLIPVYAKLRRFSLPNACRILTGCLQAQREVGGPEEGEVANGAYGAGGGRDRASVSPPQPDRGPAIYDCMAAVYAYYTPNGVRMLETANALWPENAAPETKMGRFAHCTRIQRASERVKHPASQQQNRWTIAAASCGVVRASV